MNPEKASINIGILGAMQEGIHTVEQDITGDYHLRVPGIAINDNFQVLDRYGTYSDRIYIMAVPYIGATTLITQGWISVKQLLPVFIKVL